MRGFLNQSSRYHNNPHNLEDYVEFFTSESPTLDANRQSLQLEKLCERAKQLREPHLDEPRADCVTALMFRNADPSAGAGDY